MTWAMKPCAHSLCATCKKTWEEMATQSGVTTSKCPICRAAVQNYEKLKREQGIVLKKDGEAIDFCTALDSNGTYEVKIGDSEVPKKLIGSALKCTLCSFHPSIKFNIRDVSSVEPRRYGGN